MKYNDYLLYNEFTIHYNDPRDVVPNDNYSNVTTVATVAIEVIPSANISLYLLDSLQSATVQTSILDTLSMYGEVDISITSGKSGLLSTSLEDVCSSGETKVVNLSIFGVSHNR